MGIFRLGTGLGLHPVVGVFLILAMFVPLLNLIILLVLNARATRTLREAGYKVGLLGASK